MRALIITALFLMAPGAGASSTALVINGAQIQLELPEDHVSFSKRAIVDWIKRGATTVSTYFGRFPVKSVEIVIHSENNQYEDIEGSTWPKPKIKMRIRPTVKDELLAHDWTMTHEMFHLAFPDIENDMDWMGEGLATYLEPIARARTNDMNVDEVWSELIDNMPRALPLKNHKGLNFDRTRDRIYWGGALFWLEADVQIRELTKNKKSLDTAMKAILDAGGDVTQTWSQDKIFQLSDKSVGLTIFHDLFEKMAAHPGEVDLSALWKSLGVSLNNNHVTYDDKAPLAAARKAITVHREK